MTPLFKRVLLWFRTGISFALEPLGFILQKGSVMSRFILYSGVAHGLVFVGIVTYLTTQPKESYPEFLQSQMAPNLQQAQPESSQELVEMGLSEGQETDPETTRELRERKIRASLPNPPETPRVIEKAQKAKKTSSVKIHQQSENSAQAALNAPSESVPEMGQDLPLTEDEHLAEDAQASIQEAAQAENTAPTEVATSEDEKLELAPFDVDEIAEKHKKELNQKSQHPQEATQKSVAVENEAASTQTEASGAGPASGEEVRSLGEIVQKSGNRRPEYDVDDRKAGRAGLVVYLAYISAAGKPTEFQMLASSGHRSLDAKTLKTIKTWEFQPGQEGWVEIPFQWDLKGGAQEAPSGFRRAGRL